MPGSNDNQRIENSQYALVTRCNDKFEHISSEAVCQGNEVVVPKKGYSKITVFDISSSKITHNRTNFYRDRQDITQNIVKEAYNTIKNEQNALEKYGPLKTFFSKYMAWVEVTMKEAEFPVGHSVSSVRGWPQMNGLHCMSDAHTWERFNECVCIAKERVHFKMPKKKMYNYGEKTKSLLQACLFVFSVRVYSGKYPKGHEKIDDRSLNLFKFCTNSDCDDMAITAAAFYNRLKKLPVTYTKGRAQDWCSPTALLEWARSNTDTVCCIAGSVNPKILNPRQKSSAVGKHIWCAIKSKTSNMMYHLEATRLTVPFSDEASKLLVEPFFRIKGSETRYNEESALPLILPKYIDVVGVYTTSSMALVINDDGLPCTYTEFFEGKCPKYIVMDKVPGIDSEPQTNEKIINGLRHCLDEKIMADLCNHLPKPFRNSSHPDTGYKYGSACAPWNTTAKEK